MPSQLSPKTISLVFGILVVCFAVGFYTMAVWQEPDEEAPEGNAPTPINTGIISQSKAGMISATQFGDADDPDYYLNPSGESKVATVCLGENCRNSWPETGSVTTYQMSVSGYQVGGIFWGSKTATFNCPAGAKATIISCKENIIDGGWGDDFDSCNCSVSDSQATLKAYVVMRTDCSDWWAAGRSDSCQPRSYNCTYDCVVPGPCEMQVQCGLKETVGTYDPEQCTTPQMFKRDGVSCNKAADDSYCASQCKNKSWLNGESASCSADIWNCPCSQVYGCGLQSCSPWGYSDEFCSGKANAHVISCKCYNN